MNFLTNDDETAIKNIQDNYLDLLLILGQLFFLVDYETVPLI